MSQTEESVWWLRIVLLESDKVLLFYMMSLDSYNNAVYEEFLLEQLYTISSHQTLNPCLCIEGPGHTRLA